MISGKSGNNFALADFLNEHGIEFVCIPYRLIVIDKNTKMLAIRKITRRLFRYTEYHKALAYIKEKHPNIELIHTNTSIIELGYYLSKKLNIPHIWHIREYYEEHYNLVNVLSRRNIIKAYKQSNLICVSMALKKYIELNYSGTKSNVIYNMVSINPPYDKEFCSSNKTRFAIIGIICESKGQKTVIEAAKQLIDCKHKDFELHFWGDADTEYLESIKKIMDGNEQLSERVFWHGYSNNILEELRKMDVGIVPSKNEAFGRTTIEFWANYMTVIGCNSGGSLELIKDENLLFEFGDANGLSKIMQKILMNPGKLIDNGNNNRSKAEDISEDKRADEIYEIYGEAIRKRK